MATESPRKFDHNFLEKTTFPPEKMNFQKEKIFRFESKRATESKKGYNDCRDKEKQGFESSKAETNFISPYDCRERNKTARERERKREKVLERDPLVERENFRLSGKVGSCRGENFGLNGMIFFFFPPFSYKNAWKIINPDRKKKNPK